MHQWYFSYLDNKSATNKDDWLTNVSEATYDDFVESHRRFDDLDLVTASSGRLGHQKHVSEQETVDVRLLTLQHIALQRPVSNTFH